MFFKSDDPIRDSYRVEEPDETPYCHCSICDEPIYDGEYYYLIDDEPVCIDCIDNEYRKRAGD